VTDWDPWENVPLMSQEEARRGLEAGSALFVDVRRPDQYERLRLPGAVLVPIKGHAEGLFKLPKDLDIVIY
jgi:rhodanese-related sulfurtransferase